MSDALSALGLEPDTFVWQDLALCSGFQTNLFFDDYESSAPVAKMIDEMCLSCPVMNQCLEAGIENDESGVWGSIFLTQGKADTSRNKHKSQDTWESIRERIGGDSE